MTRSPSTTSKAASVMLEPTSPGSLSTVTTSSSATFSCLPPQRTIAYTRELSLSFALPSVPRNSGVTTAGSLERAHGRPRSGLTPDRQGYQTSAPTRTQAVRLPDLWWRARGNSDDQGVAGSFPGFFGLRGEFGGLWSKNLPREPQSTRISVANGS